MDDELLLHVAERPADVLRTAEARADADAGNQHGKIELVAAGRDGVDDFSCSARPAWPRSARRRWAPHR